MLVPQPDNFCQLDKTQKGGSSVRYQTDSLHGRYSTSGWRMTFANPISACREIAQ